MVADITESISNRTQHQSNTFCRLIVGKFVEDTERLHQNRQAFLDSCSSDEILTLVVKFNRSILLVFNLGSTLLAAALVIVFGLPRSVGKFGPDQVLLAVAAEFGDLR